MGLEVLGLGFELEQSFEEACMVAASSSVDGELIIVVMVVPLDTLGVAFDSMVIIAIAYIDRFMELVMDFQP